MFSIHSMILAHGTQLLTRLALILANLRGLMVAGSRKGREHLECLCVAALTKWNVDERRSARNG